MQKTTLLIITVLLVAQIQKTKAQQLYKCDTTKAYWAFESDNNFLYVKLSGNAVGTQQPRIISVNKMPIQVLIVNKAPYVKDGDDNTERALLTRYAKGEADYFSGSFKTPLSTHISSVDLPGDKKAIFWYFDMPETISKQVKAQLFALLVSGDKIFSLSGTQFNNQDLRTVGNFILNVMATLTKVDSKDAFGALCGK